MRLAGLFDDALGGILKGGAFGMAGNIGKEPSKYFGVVGRTTGLDANGGLGLVGSIAGYDKPLHKELGLPGWDSFGGLFS